MKIKKNEFDKLNIKPKKGDRIFLYGDLGAGKTTFSKYILNDILGVKDEVTSPTYTYYNKYSTSAPLLLEERGIKGKNINKKEKINIYHFDLYRLKDYDEFFNIAGEDIFDDEENIILVEWPEIIEKYYKPTIKVEIFKTKEEDKREVLINNCKV